MAVTQRAQVCESARLAWILALPFATLGCAIGRGTPAESTSDAAQPDGAAAGDAATQDARTDAAEDAPGCAIAAGITPVLDGTDDLAAYPSAQQLSPGAMLGSDAAAIAWNGTHLFVTVRSSAFTAPYEPLHVYLETGATLAAATAAPGKEYSNLTAAVPFTPTHLLAARRVSDSGSGATYNGVFVPGDGWVDHALALDAVVAADQQTLSLTVPWSALGGCPTVMRLALHVVHAQTANEWKDLVPSSHTPWQMPGGGYYEVDLTGSLAVSAWMLR